MIGALALVQPSHLLAKLGHEARILSANHNDAYAALNALRDAYHLREWVWHSRLENNPVRQAAVMGGIGSEDHWNNWVNGRFADFPLIRELCNGSKHFECKNTDRVQASHRAGYGSPLFAYDVGPLGYGVAGYFLSIEGGRIVSVTYLVESVLKFWRDLFQRFPELA